MILIAGDQLTGKSTQAKNLANYYQGTFYSVGNLFREVAAQRGITVAEQAKLLLTERGIDVEIDYKTCEMISGNKVTMSPYFCAPKILYLGWPWVVPGISWIKYTLFVYA